MSPPPPYLKLGLAIATAKGAEVIETLGLILMAILSIVHMAEFQLRVGSHGILASDSQHPLGYHKIRYPAVPRWVP